MARTIATGFTLAELLIALAILAEIATFAIPKILVAQQVSTNRARAKEVAGAIAGVFQVAKAAGKVSQNSAPTVLLPYMNYVSLDTSGSQIDWPVNTSGAATCDSTNKCVNLHGGGKLMFYDTGNFGGTASTNVIMFLFDPDGTYVASAADGPSKTIIFLVYYNGFMTSGGRLKAGTCDSNNCPWGAANPSDDPTWFQW
jgi:prepilin-type N-terminal cleavage/methylation domain-containing protein